MLRKARKFESSMKMRKYLYRNNVNVSFVSYVCVGWSVCIENSSSSTWNNVSICENFLFFRPKSFELSQLCDAYKRPRAHIHNMSNEWMNIFPHFHTHILHISIIYEVSSFSLFKQRGVHSEKPYVHRFVVDKRDLATERKRTSWKSNKNVLISKTQPKQCANC